MPLLDPLGIHAPSFGEFYQCVTDEVRFGSVNAQSSSGLAKRKSCASSIPLSTTYTGCILSMGLFSRSNAASSSW